MVRLPCSKPTPAGLLAPDHEVQQRGPWSSKGRGSHDWVFRRSIARLSDSLSTLRRVRYLTTTQDSLPVAGQALLDGLLTRKIPMKGFKVVNYISSPFPKLSWRNRCNRHLEPDISNCGGVSPPQLRGSSADRWNRRYCCFIGGSKRWNCEPRGNICNRRFHPLEFGAFRSTCPPIVRVGASFHPSAEPVAAANSEIVMNFIINAIVTLCVSFSLLGQFVQAQDNPKQGTFPETVSKQAKAANSDAGERLDEPRQARKTRILWLGRGGSRESTDEMVNASGRFNVESTSVGKYFEVGSIAQNGNYDQVGFDSILSGKYDFVMLKVSRGSAIAPETRTKSLTVIRRICDVITESGAVPVLSVSAVADKRIGNIDFSVKQEWITGLCVEAAAENNARLAPLGAAWAVAAREMGQNYLLRNNRPDDLHGNLRSEYLGRCCFYAALTGESPVGNKATHGLTTKDARYLQQVAWDQYQNLAEEKRKVETDLLFSERDSTRTPGYAIAVVKDGSIAYSNGYGMADLEHRVAIGPETVFNTASVSKQFTAFAIASLANQDLLSFDDDIHKYLPKLSDFGHTITIRHLVHQTSGLREVSKLQSFVMQGDEIGTQARALEIIRGQSELNFNPGEEFQDCSTNYLLLATIVERVTGKSYRDWIREHIFVPRKMTGSDVHDDYRQSIPGGASDYLRGGTAGFQKNVTTDFNYGAGGIYSTATDLARWLLYLHHPPSTDVPIIEQMFQRGVLNNGNAIDFALGLTVDRYRGLPRIGHAGGFVAHTWLFGGFEGYASYAGYFPDQNFGVVVLSNEAPLAYDKAMKAVGKYLAEHLDEPAESSSTKPKIAVTVESRALDAIVGNYVLPGGAFAITREGNDIYAANRLVIVTPEENSLRAALTSPRKLRIFPASETEFFYRQFSSRLSFVKNKQGRVTHLNYWWERGTRLSSEVVFSPTSEGLAAFAGSYVSRELNTSFSVAVDDNDLVTTHPNLGNAFLARLSVDIFFSPLGVMRFERDAKGQVTGFRLTNSDESVRNLHFERSN